MTDSAQLDRMWANRRLLAERFGWPAGTLQACEQLDAAFPGWSVYWRGVSPAHPAAFVASRIGTDVKVCAGTVEGVAAAMEVAPEWATRLWQRNQCCPPKSAPVTTG